MWCEEKEKNMCSREKKELKRANKQAKRQARHMFKGEQGLKEQV